MPHLSLLIRAAICFVFVFLPLQNLDQWFYDRLFRLRGARHRPTSFVLVQTSLTDQTEGGYANIWPSRDYRNLLEKIEADHPKLIVFASYFDRVPPGHDSRSTDRQPDLIFSASLNEDNKLIPPPLGLTSQDNYGFNNLYADSDNTLRRSRLIYSSGVSLALRMYHRFTDAPVKRNLLDPLWIDFRGPSTSYPTYQAADILNPAKQLKGVFADKIVLIGRDGGRDSDMETPFGKMSRLEIHANIMDTFIDNREIRLLSRTVSSVIALAAVSLSIGAILYFPLTLAWLLLLIFATGIIVVSLILFAQFKIWVGLANPIFAIFGTHLVILGYKLSRQEEQQWKIQQESEYLRELDRFKNNFISLFSHDLKTPIAKIRAVVERLLNDRTDLPATIKDSLHTIDRTNSELARLITDILKVTKMESMPLEPAREVVDLNRLVESAVSRLQFIADEKQIEIALDLEPLFSMEGDAHLLLEVITNLLENAIKYSPSHKKVTVRTREENGRVHVYVADEGPGIPADELPRVTGKFYRGSNAESASRGSGLGLYLAKYFVELHQGTIDIRNLPTGGTEVSFWLPLDD